MTLLGVFLAGLAAGAALVWWLERGTRAYLQGELTYYRRELATAQDRITYAFRDERAIPAPRPIEAPPPPKPLPPELVDAVMEWEAPEARAAAERQIRELYEGRQWGVQAILKHLQNEGLQT